MAQNTIYIFKAVFQIFHKFLKINMVHVLSSCLPKQNASEILEKNYKQNPKLNLFDLNCSRCSNWPPLNSWQKWACLINNHVYEDSFPEVLYDHYKIAASLILLNVDSDIAYFLPDNSRKVFSLIWTISCWTSTSLQNIPEEKTHVAKHTFVRFPTLFWCPSLYRFRS